MFICSLNTLMYEDATNEKSISSLVYLSKDGKVERHTKSITNDNTKITNIAISPSML